MLFSKKNIKKNFWVLSRLWKMENSRKQPASNIDILVIIGKLKRDAYNHAYKREEKLIQRLIECSVDSRSKA